MSQKLYRLYRIITLAKYRIYRKVSRFGMLMIFFAAFSTLAGINTRQTMIYQLAAISISLLLFAFPLSFFFKPSLFIRRLLPRTCTAGEKLSYYLELENIGDKKVTGLFFVEKSAASLPGFEEFHSAEETGERKRNYVDRKFGYYRWRWLLEKSIGTRFDSFTLPSLEKEEKTRTEVSFIPVRRGYIQLAGFSVFRLEPFGLFKTELFHRDPGRILVLPKLFPVVQGDLKGSRRYHQGGLSGAASSGDSGEFVSLRDYRPGDQVKHIDWKATARVNEPIVRQFQDEYFSRYGIVLDTFMASGLDQVFEDAVSVAASVLLEHDSNNGLIDLLFAGDNCVTSLSTGMGQSSQEAMLELLACITCCRTRQFSELTGMVVAHTNILSSLFLVFVDLDEQRKELITYLKTMKIPYKVILITSDKRESKKLIEKFSLPEVRLFDVMEKTKLVDMT